MSGAPTFLLDANVLISAHRQYYAFDLCPGFWDSLLHHFSEDSVCSIDRVKSEIKNEGDVLADWVNDTLPAAFFCSSDQERVTEIYGQMMVWAQGQKQFKPEAKTEFAKVADSWIMAYAKAHDMTVVTHEVFSVDAKRKVPMPNVCTAFDIPFLNTFAMLRHLKTQFSFTYTA